MACSINTTDPYRFNRNHRSSARLNLLHVLYTNIAGYLIHPAVPATQTKACVADVGTGTGIWCIDISNEVDASVTIDGFDISPDQFPHQSFLPTNVRFYVQDTYKPFPQQFVGKYDLLVVRFLVTVVTSESLGPLIENLVTLLKPGGYLQWTEPDNTAVKPITHNGDTPHESFKKLTRMMRKIDDDRAPKPGWIHGLGPALSTAGFENVSITAHPVPARYRPFMTQIHLLTLEDVRADRVENEEQLQDLHNFISGLNEELKTGVALDWGFICVIAQKPAT